MCKRYDHYDEPQPGDYESLEEYEEAVARWKSAEDDYIEDYLERHRN